MLGPRLDCLDWDDYFMLMAMIVSQRSKDPSTQVGAIIVSADNVVVGTGYNGPAKGIDANKIPWDREGDFVGTKYPYVRHAEENAVASALRRVPNLKGCKVYSTLFPCHKCANELVHHDCRDIFYLKDRSEESFVASKIILDEVGANYKQYLVEKKRLTSIFIALTKML